MQGSIANSYWVRPGQLLAGEYPGTSDILRQLLAAGVTFFLDPTEETKLLP